MRELVPGSDHIMLMGVAQPLLPGGQVTITLVFSDGSSMDQVFEVKDFSGAEEEYVGDMDHMGESEEE
jgi:copper(I)-binding protein